MNPRIKPSGFICFAVLMLIAATTFEATGMLLFLKESIKWCSTEPASDWRCGGYLRVQLYLTAWSTSCQSYLEVEPNHFCT